MKNPAAEQFFKEKVNEIMNASHANIHLKRACKLWLDAVGTDKEEEMSKKLITKLESDVLPMDELVWLLNLPGAKAHFGEETVKAYLKEAEERIAKGEQWCFCDACTPGRQILDRKDELV
ncbi:MAG: heat-shock protein Hsp90 [Clostridia bacterium]|nr:heat-shock protein Hsp90 [Clostridia bacterium]